MKKIILLTCVLLTANVQAALPTGNGEFEIKAPIFRGGFEFGATAYYLKAAATELDYLLIYPSGVVAQPGIVPQGEGTYANATPNNRFGYGFDIRYYFPCTSFDVFFAWNHYNQSDTATTEPGAGVILPVLRNAIAIPAIIENIVTTTPPEPMSYGDQVVIPANNVLSANQASAYDDFSCTAVDFDFGKTLNIDTFFKLRWYGGLRYARLKHHFNVFLDFSQVPLVESNVINLPAEFGNPAFALTTTATFSTLALEQATSENTHFSGLGPSLGVDAELHIGSGFGLFGDLKTSLLVGEKSSTVASTLSGSNSITLESIATSTEPSVPLEIPPVLIQPAIGVPFPITLENIQINYPEEFVVVPNLQARIGIDYTYQYANCSRFSAELGYFVDFYFNALDRLSGLVVEDAIDSRHPLNTSFSGPYIRLSYAF